MKDDLTIKTQELFFYDSFMKLIDFRQNKTSELVRREYYRFNVLGVYDKSKNYTELNTFLDD